MPNAPDITIEPGVVQTKGGTTGLMPRNIEYPADKYSIEEVVGHIAYMNDISDECPGCEEITEAIEKEGIEKKARSKSSGSTSEASPRTGRNNDTGLRIPPLLKRKTLREIILSRYDG